MKPKKICKQNLRNKSVLRQATFARFKDKDYSELSINVKKIVVIRGFGSGRKYVKAVSKLYSREINDIDRFVHFAESLVKQD
ncbi:hypothetical protein ELOC111193_18790 [Elizabethkingia occulta]|uniref:Uncharacterized protein n=1 Tax=Elizabethkingia occulta TaxID=1867263 RepID=A0A1T3MHY6_9FLAO|nr:hypothetical protein [Elizabethkingia occulta]OPC63891.1 hypothetical protein BAZ10_07400 [Elizabethkingia occulta]